MRIKGLTEQQLRDALTETNKMHDYDLIFKREPEGKGNYLLFTIRSRISGIRGASISFSGRNSVSASWHAHGHLFDMIIDRYPDAIIITAKSTITKNGGNWIDYNIGSMMCPMFASDCSIC